LTALKVRSLALSRWAFGYAFLDVCLHAAKARSFALQYALLISFPGPSAVLLRSALHNHLIYGRGLREKAAFKTHSRSLARAAPAASFLRLDPKRRNPNTVACIVGIVGLGRRDVGGRGRSS